MSIKAFTTSFIVVASLAVPMIATTNSANAQATPSANKIFKQLNRISPAKARSGKKTRLSIRQLKRDRRLRHRLPSIDIQSINFSFGSARIGPQERWKVGNIADALLRFSGYGEQFLLEGHTDAVGSRGSNQYLSERRSHSLKRALTNWFGVPPRMLITVGYGEDDLLVPTRHENWRNRRVTLRRVTGIVRN